jgi:hypothetical protein
VLPADLASVGGKEPILSLEEIAHSLHPCQLADLNEIGVVQCRATLGTSAILIAPATPQDAFNS